MMSKKRLVDYLDLSAENALTAIENEGISISGASEAVVQHSSMFYQPFSESICQQLCGFFAECMASTAHQSRRSVLANIERLVSSNKDEEIPTIESLLYASRVANSRILNDAVLFDELAKDVAQCYEYNSEISFEVVKHIFKTWNWDCQIGIALVGSISAEKNQVKREQLLSEMDKYIEAKKDQTHQLLLFKVKAMITRGNEYCARVFEVIQKLNGKYNIDVQIASVIKQDAPAIFKGKADVLALDFPPKYNPLAKAVIRDIRQMLGFIETDDIVGQIILGNEDETIREAILRKMVCNRTPVEYYCKIIRKNHLNSYIPALKDLICNYDLNVHNKCCIALTCVQLIQGRPEKFDELICATNLPDDFAYLLRYVFWGKQGLAYLKEATLLYFSDDCSQLLRKGIIHTTKYDIEVSNCILDIFSSILQETNERTNPNVMRRFDSLLRDQKSWIRNKINKSTMFLMLFSSYLHDSSVNLDAFPDFFDEMINIVDHCPPPIGDEFWFDMYEKTQNPQRQITIRNKMRSLDVTS